MMPALHHLAFAERARPFAEAGVFDRTDLLVVDQLARTRPDEAPDVLLALALAVRAPRTGHVCVDLADLSRILPPPQEGSAGADPPAWPADRDAWLARVAGSALVRTEAQDSTRPFVLDGARLYTARYHGYEERLARRLQALAASVRPVPDPLRFAEQWSRLFDRPHEPPGPAAVGVLMALLRGLAVLTGGPGTGKTYTVKSLIALLYGQWQASRATAGQPGHAVQAGQGTAPLTVALAAPTGKAALRMKQAVLEDLATIAATLCPDPAEAAALAGYLAALPTFTLHRLLGWDPGNRTRFRHHAGRPLPYDVIVVDEASMADLAMMTRLCEAVRDDARLVLLGDHHQLASVDAGSVLGDICAGLGGQARVSPAFVAEVQAITGIDLAPHVAVGPSRGLADRITWLTRPRRYRATSGIAALAGAIVTATDAAGRDRLAAALATLQDGGYDDARLLGHDPGGLSAAVRAEVFTGYAPYLDALRAGPLPDESEPVFHARLLVAFDGFRVLCAHRSGRLGVAGLNATVTALLAAAGRIPASAQWYLGRPVLVTSNDYAVRRFNGDVGLAVRREGQPGLVVAFAGEQPGQVEYLAPSRLPAHETVFAMTVHKSQGSQFGHALVVLPARSSPLLTRELVYTGITRARERLTLAGSPDVLRAALAQRVQRASGLADRLWPEPG